jgi:hypothetical protein
MDPGDLEVPADSHSLQRGYLSGDFEKERIVAAQVRRRLSEVSFVTRSTFFLICHPQLSLVARPRY